MHHLLKHSKGGTPTVYKNFSVAIYLLFAIFPSSFTLYNFTIMFFQWDNLHFVDNEYFLVYSLSYNEDHSHISLID